MISQEYESIIEKAKKIMSLSEKGIAGEADNARRKLEALLHKHGLTLGDLSIEQKREYSFTIANDEEGLILNHILMAVTDDYNICCSYYRGKKQKQYVSVTPLQYIEVNQMYLFYITQYRKERRSILKNLGVAFVHKHNLFPKTKEQKEDLNSSVDEEQIRKILRLMGTLDDVKYQKAITQ